MSGTKKSQKTKTYTGKPKSIGPKFCAILLIFILAIFALISNLILLKVVREEMKVTFDRELQTTLQVLASNIETLYKTDSSDIARTLALQMVDNAAWDSDTHQLYVTRTDSVEVLAGKKISENFYSFAENTEFDLQIVAGYDQVHFGTYAYPQTEQYIRISTATTLIIALFALGTCIIAFHRSARRCC